VEQFSTGTKATAFIITAGIQIVLTVAFYMCGVNSMKADAELEQKEIAMQTQMYQRVEQQDPNQIPM
jgi:hypothetical protein